MAGARLTLTLSRVKTKASSASMATELQVEVDDAFCNRQGFGGFPVGGPPFISRLRSSKGGDEGIRRVGKLMERANLQDLEMLNRGGKTQARVRLGKKRTAGFADLARPYHFFRKRAAGASKSREMLEMEKGWIRKGQDKTARM